MFNLTFSCENILVTAASVSGCIVILRSIANNVIPNAVRAYFSTRITALSNRFSSQITALIEEVDGITPNLLFAAANTYLGSKLPLSSTRCFKVNCTGGDKDLLISMDRDSHITDHHNNVEFNWLLCCNPMNFNNKPSEKRTFKLFFHKKHQEMVLTVYLPHILREVKAIREQNKAVKLYMLGSHTMDMFSSVVLNHPATMETVAMEEEAKKALIEDLERFRNGEEFYKRVGRAWKRGYLLYGPPGTGKSSLVVAIAKHLNYSIYDVDLKRLHNSLLRRLIGTERRSILVIEDIDCSIELTNRVPSSNTNTNGITLAALLNLIDGLWSSCGEERIIIVTTNHKERLDPALLRPGRMDVHVEMSYCTFHSFKLLAKNYLGVESDPIFTEIEVALKEAQATPVEVVEELMKSKDTKVALGGLLRFLQAKAGPC